MPSDFYVFLMIKNTPAERKSPWDNHKSFRSTTSITTVAAAVASTTATNFCGYPRDFSL